ncbi:carbohydrate ABC transporter permease [Microbacterium aoyamense]|uniref:Carbohydrate ABC transporter permease n=1 Tax=Microbacterium aoyamense TaxID=344166 RepID=A0ABN2PL60_9MICO|nr:carbohydrate ABC transporter permease [Microbacterium aoyamense]
MGSGIVTYTGTTRRRLPSTVKPFYKAVGFWITASLLLVLFLAPFLWIVASSFKGQFNIFADSSPLSWRTFFPVDGTWENYILAFSTECTGAVTTSSCGNNVGVALMNSAIVAICQVVLTIVLAVPAAYALTRLRFRGQNLIFGLVLVTFMIPGEAITLPLFQIAQFLGLQDTYAGVFLPWVASPFALFLLRQAFYEIPRELDEAARMDGAGHFRIMVQMIVPNVKPALASVALMTFMFAWNSYMWPLVIISSPDKVMVQVATALNAIPGALPSWGPTFAGAVVASIPVIVLFLFLQRYFVRGVVMSGLKG